MINRQALRPLGWLLALIAGAYFVRYSWHSLAGKDLSPLLGSREIAATSALCLLYMLLIPTTAFAWTLILRDLGQPVRLAQTLPVLATTQFGKYLPGNIAQHLGRVALLRRFEVRTSTVFFSLGYEMMLMLVACAHLSALTLLWALPPQLQDWPLFAHRGLLLLCVTVGAAVGLSLVPRLARWVETRRSSDEPPPRNSGLNFRTGAVCYGLYVSNFFLVGAGLYLLTQSLVAGNAEGSGVIYLTGAFASSWVLGFLAPGAPAGLGVREAILSIWLGTIMTAPEVVVVVVALRIATTVGDLLNFLWGTLALKRVSSTPRVP